MKASTQGNLATNGITALERLAQTELADRQPYSPPCLVELGDVRMLTLGGTPGFGDSQVDPREN